MGLTITDGTVNLNSCDLTTTGNVSSANLTLTGGVALITGDVGIDGTTSGQPAPDVLTLNGGDGGDASDSGGFGGPGSDIKPTTGNGGDVNNVGGTAGQGGDVHWITGGGGSCDFGAGSGGRGGDYTIVLGGGGTGNSTNGRDGQFIVTGDSTFTGDLTATGTLLCNDLDVGGDVTMLADSDDTLTMEVGTGYVWSDETVGDVTLQLTTPVNAWYIINAGTFKVTADQIMLDSAVVTFSGGITADSFSLGDFILKEGGEGVGIYQGPDLLWGGHPTFKIGFEYSFSTTEADFKGNNIINIGDIDIDGAFNHDGSTFGAYGTVPITQAILATGSTNDQIITALQNLGLVKQS